MSTPLSMADVEALIARRRDELIVGHEFMRRLEGDADLRALRRLLPRLGIFPFAFQDMLRLAGDIGTEPVLTRISVRSRRVTTPLRLVLADLETTARLGAYEAFGREHETVRRVAYALIVLISRARCDHARLAVLLTMEAAAREFFLRIQGFAKRAGVTRELRYFGGMHLEAEEAHEVFSDDLRRVTKIIVRRAPAECRNRREKLRADARFADDWRGCVVDAVPNRFPAGRSRLYDCLVVAGVNWGILPNGMSTVDFRTSHPRPRSARGVRGREHSGDRQTGLLVWRKVRSWSFAMASRSSSHGPQARKGLGVMPVVEMDASADSEAQRRSRTSPNEGDQVFSVTQKGPVQGCFSAGDMAGSWRRPSSSTQSTAPSRTRSLAADKNKRRSRR